MGAMKESLFNYDEQPEMFRHNVRDYAISESAERLEEMVSRLIVSMSVPDYTDQDKINFMLDDLHSEIAYLNDTIRRH